MRRSVSHPRHSILAALALLIATLCAAAYATDYPLTITDDLGREVTLSAAPERIVTMIPSHTETVCALDACDRLVAVDEFSNHPEEVEELPHLGSAYSPNLEAIVAAEPDLVLVDESSGISEALEDLDITVYAGTGQTLQEVFDSFQTLGLLLDAEAEADRLTERVRDELDEVEAAVAERAPPRVYYELDASPFSVGPASFIGELIRRAGGDNIVDAGRGEFPQLDPEFVIAQDPEVIVLGDAPHGVTAESVAQRPGWADITAVRDGAIVELDQEQVDVLNRPGPRIGEAVALLARIFHPEAF